MNFLLTFSTRIQDQPAPESPAKPAQENDTKKATEEGKNEIEPEKTEDKSTEPEKAESMTEGEKSPQKPGSENTKSTPKKVMKMCPVSSVDAKMIRADKNVLESQKLREYIKLKFEYEEVQGKVCQTFFVSCKFSSF